MNYYEEIIETIKDAIKNKDIKKAEGLLFNELNMPYIPSEYEAIFIELKKEVYLLEKSNIAELDDETLISYLNSDDNKLILLASSLIASKNIRNYLDEIKTYLNNPKCLQAASILIEEMINQKVSDSIHYNKNGIEFDFIPSLIENPFNDDFKESIRLIDIYLSKYPYIIKLVKDMFIHEIYLNLPLVYEKDELKILLKTVLYKAFMIYEDLETYKIIIKNNGLDNLKTFEIADL